MKHFEHQDTVQVKTTPGNWLMVGSQITTVLNDWAIRNDLVAKVMPKTNAPVAALFDPASAEIEISINEAFGIDYDPLAIGDYTKRRTQLKFAKATGAMYHEACHARFTKWSLKRASEVLTPAEFGAMHILEEGRIEHFGAMAMPKNRALLRTCALEIVLGDLKADGALEKLNSVQAVAHTLALTYARVDAGVLEYSDVADVITLAETIIGAETLDQLRNIWLAFQQHDQHENAEPLYDLAREWAKIVAETSSKQEDEDGEDGDPTEGGDPTSGGTGKSGKPSKEEIIEAIIKAIEDSADNATIEAQIEIDDQVEQEDWAEEVENRKAATQERDDSRDVANEVFGKGTSPTKAKTASRLIEKRQPTSTERIAAVQIAKALERAKYRERTQTEVNRELPPGRLRSRAVVQREALKSKGVRGIKSDPFRAIQRKHTDSPELKIGVMVDISGSMRPAMQPMAVTAWALSEATRRVDGKCAMVYYGNDVFATLKPGQHLPEVRVYSAPDGTESFDKGFKALDGALGMVSGTGARLLVVVSDGQYTPYERTAVKKWLKRCYETGVAVLWISYNDPNPMGLVGNYGKVVVLKSGDTAEAARQIGKSAIGAINAITAKR